MKFICTVLVLVFAPVVSFATECIGRSIEYSIDGKFTEKKVPMELRHKTNGSALVYTGRLPLFRFIATHYPRSESISLEIFNSQNYVVATALGLKFTDLSVSLTGKDTNSALGIIECFP